MDDDSLEIRDSAVTGDVVTGIKGDIVNITQQILSNPENPEEPDKIFQNTYISAFPPTDSVFSPSINDLDIFLDHMDAFYNLEKINYEENNELMICLHRDLKGNGFCQALTFRFDFFNERVLVETGVTFSEIDAEEYYNFEIDSTKIGRKLSQRIMIQFLNNKDILNTLPFKKYLKSDGKHVSEIIDDHDERNFLDLWVK